MPFFGSILLKKNRWKLREVKNSPAIYQLREFLVKVAANFGALSSLGDSHLQPSPIDHPSDIVPSTRKIY
jgi:hypothetical protein